MTMKSFAGGSKGKTTFNFYQATLGLESSQVSEVLSLYPNPTNGQFQVRFYNQLNEPATIMVYNALGQLIHQKAIVTGTAYSRTDMDLGNNAAGVYIVKVVGANGKECYVTQI